MAIILILLIEDDVGCIIPHSMVAVVSLLFLSLIISASIIATLPDRFFVEVKRDAIYQNGVYLEKSSNGTFNEINSNQIEFSSQIDAPFTVEKILKSDILPLFIFDFRFKKLVVPVED